MTPIEWQRLGPIYGEGPYKWHLVLDRDGWWIPCGSIRAEGFNKLYRERQADAPPVEEQCQRCAAWLRKHEEADDAG